MEYSRFLATTPATTTRPPVRKRSIRNTTGGDNTAAGWQALYSNTTGGDNTALGDSALNGNTTGDFNTAMGFATGTGVTTANDGHRIGAGVTGANVSNTAWIG